MKKTPLATPCLVALLSVCVAHGCLSAEPAPAPQAAVEPAPLPAIPRTLGAAEHHHADEHNLEQLIRELTGAVDAGKPAAGLAYKAAEEGMAAVWAAAKLMDLERQEYRAPFLVLAEHAAVSRKYHPELLRLYDPPSYRAFYTPAGVDLQGVIGQALHWENPPRNMPNATVLAAPEPTFTWLAAHRRGIPANPGRLIDILDSWGSTVGIGRERHYVPRLRELAAQLAANPAIRGDEKMLGALLRFLLVVPSQSAVQSLAACESHRAAEVRVAAVEALGAVAEESALQALLDWAEREKEPSVLVGIAKALGRWPERAEAGAACLRLFEKAADPTVQRSVLYSAGVSKWPQRNQLIHQALAQKNSMLLGAVFAAGPVPGLKEELIRLLDTWEGETPEPDLIDALAASRVEPAAPVLAKALSREANIAMRLKLIFALEKIRGEAAEQALLEALAKTKNELEAEYLISAIGNLKLSAAIPSLSKLAKRRDIPMVVRVQAIWALGCMPDTSAREQLSSIDAYFTELFAGPAAAAKDYDAAFHRQAAKPHLLLARYRHDPAGADKEISRLFAEGDPLVQTFLLLGLLDQKSDHPIVALGLRSKEFYVLCTSIAAAREAAPAKYRKRIMKLAASPFVRAAADVRGESWDLHKLLENP